MEIWSVQPREAWAGMYVAELGVYAATWGHPDAFQNPDASHNGRAYAWLRRELRARLLDYSGSAPIWAWPSRDAARAVLEQETLSNLEDLVIVEARVDPGRVLPSCYNRWHAALNEGAICDCWSTDEDCGCDPESTWNWILRLDAALPWLVEGYGEVVVQLCVDRVRRDEVVAVRSPAEILGASGPRAARPW